MPTNRCLGDRTEVFGSDTAFVKVVFSFMFSFMRVAALSTRGSTSYIEEVA